MTPDIRTIRTVRASDIPSTDHRDPTAWGPWRLAPEWLTLEHAEEVYEINLMEARTSAECLDWICQVAGKTWTDPAAVAGLVVALADVLQLQARVHRNGRGRSLTRDQVRNWGAAAASWAPIYAGADA
jgi:hypothetical protein